MAYRVLIAQFMHETNTFSKLPTTLDDYRKRWLIEAAAIVARFKGTKNEVGGYIEASKLTVGQFLDQWLKEYDRYYERSADGHCVG